MGNQPKKVVIAGAGCAGLAAGIALQKRGFDVTILESSNRVGGLAGGVVINNNIYEYGPHIFHTTDPEVLADVKRIAGHVLIPYEKTIKIKFLGKYFDFPLSMPDILTKLPPTTVVRAMASFGKHYAGGIGQSEASLDNSEKVLRRYYGDVLYKLFFKDYIQKVWGMEPSEMAASFARERIPRFDVLDVIDKFKKKFFKANTAEVSVDSYVERVEGENFTTKQGFALITEAYAEEFTRVGGTLLLNATMTSIKTRDKKAHEVTYLRRDVPGDTRSLSCDQVISTIPIKLLPKVIHPQPEQPVLDAAEKLMYRGILFVGLLVKKKAVLPASFMYFRDKSFNRITDLGRFDIEVQPEGCTILIAEITAQPGDTAWHEEKATATNVIVELADEGLLNPDDVLETHVFKAEYGYPIYRVGYEAALKSTLDGIASYQNIHTIGRQGRFAYINTHIAMKMGYEVARKIEAL